MFQNACSRCLGLFSASLRSSSKARPVSRFYSGLQFEEFEDTKHKSHVELSSKSEVVDPLLLTGYHPGGFQFRGNTLIKGPIVVIDRVVFQWKIDDVKQISAASFSLFEMIYPKVDLIIVGTGDSCEYLSTDILDELRSRGIGVEVQDTPHACGTYNLLKGQRPKTVGAALIPITEAKPKKYVTTGPQYAIASGQYNST